VIGERERHRRRALVVEAPSVRLAHGDSERDVRADPVELEEGQAYERIPVVQLPGKTVDLARQTVQAIAQGPIETLETISGRGGAGEPGVSQPTRRTCARSPDTRSADARATTRSGCSGSPDTADTPNRSSSQSPRRYPCRGSIPLRWPVTTDDYLVDASWHEETIPAAMPRSGSPGPQGNRTDSWQSVFDRPTKAMSESAPTTAIVPATTFVTFDELARLVQRRRPRRKAAPNEQLALFER
jgi:hypothetical protein